MLTELYLSLSRHTLQIGHVYNRKERKRLLELEIAIRTELPRSQRLLSTMTNELSLLPVHCCHSIQRVLQKPMKRYQEVVNTLERLLDLLSGLRRIREKIPKRETVVAVMTQRKDFVRDLLSRWPNFKVSSICISFMQQNTRSSRVSRFRSSCHHLGSH
jgi:hypothetical protein